MSVFSHHEFDDHERVLFGSESESGLRAIIAIHNTNRGPSLGGCRMWPYRSDEEALRDVLRLSRGMTYKSAMANLPLGGGKSVIIGDPRRHKTDSLLRAMGRFVDTLGGRYVAAEDSGTNVADLKTMGEETDHVAGIVDKPTSEGTVRSGDPSPATAYGTFVGLKATVKFRLGREDLSGLRVAVQGVGNVGYRLAEHLHEAGAKLWVTDIHADAVQRCVDELGANAVGEDEIFALDVDVFAPCAMGAIINDKTIATLKAKVIAGAANNQLAEERHGATLLERGVLYAPDYVVNAGGIIDVCYERQGYDRDKMFEHVNGIRDTLLEIYERAKVEGLPTGIVADQIAEERFRRR